MGHSKLPEARAVSKSVRERLYARLPTPARLWRVAKYAAAVAGASGAVFALVLAADSLDAYQAKERARAAVDCERYDGVRIDDITRLQAVNVMNQDSGEIYLRAWRMYVEPAGSSKVDISDNGCDYEFIKDVPPGKPMWAYQTAEMRSGSCRCSIKYHIRSMSDPNVSTAERDIY